MKPKNYFARCGELGPKLGLAICAVALLPLLAIDMAKAQSVDEIIVTATKRERSLQDIPVSVTALSADTLANEAVTNLDSLQYSVPGLSMTTGSGLGWASSLRMRGVGTSGTNIGFEGAVGVFVDGVFRPRAGAALSNLLDVERVEVLRGPQGTLFGRNTTAGAISVVSKKPVMDETSSSLRLTVGDYGRTQLQGIYNTPLSDKTAARIALDYDQRDGILENQVDGRDDLNDRDRVGMKGQMLFEPNDEMQVRVIANYFSADEACCGAVIFKDGRDNAAAPLNLVTVLDKTLPSTDREDFETARNFETVEKQDETGLQVDFEWNMPNGITFFNSAAYSDYEMSGHSDADQTALNFINQPDNFVKQKQFTNEFRFSGVMDDFSSVQSVAWILGGYYSEEALGLDYAMRFGADADAMQNVLGATPTRPNGDPNPFANGFGFTTGDSHDAFMSQDAEVAALFAHADIDINDRWAASIGTRFTSEEKTGRGVFVTDHNPFRINLFASDGAKNFAQSNDLEESIANFTLTSKLSDDVSVYASYADGYKSGGFNLDVLGGQAGAHGGTPRSILSWGAIAEGVEKGDLPPSALPANVAAILAESRTNPAAVADLPDFPGDPSFEAETVDTFELGVKSRLMDGRATLNATAFSSVFENYQLLQFTGTSFNVLSAPEVTTSGFEAEAQINVSDNLTVGLQYTNAKAEYTEAVASVGIADGATMNNAPEHMAGLNATYTRDLSNGLKGLAFVGLSYESEYIASAGLEADRIQDDFTMVQGRLGVYSEDDKYGLELWCRNCTNEAVAQVIFTSPVADSSLYAFTSTPAEFGLTLSARY